MDRTSQCFRMAERPPATDLRGGKTSEDSFTIWIASLVVEYAVDFRLDLFLDVALGSAVSSEDFVRFLFPGLKTDRIRSDAAERSVLRGRVWLDESSGIKSFAYCWVPDHERSKDWTLAKSRDRSQDLESTLWDVARPGRLPLGLRWSRHCSWLHFALDDASVVDG